MLRIRERIGMRKKDVGVPITGEGADLSLQSPQQMIRIPGKNPAVEDRIAEVARDITRQAPGERPGQRDRQAGISREGVSRDGIAPERLSPEDMNNAGGECTRTWITLRRIAGQ